MKLPMWALRDPRIKPGVMRDVFMCLLWHQGTHDAAWPKVATIASEMGYSDRAVRGAIQALEAARIVVVDRSGRSRGLPSKYRVVDRDPAVSETRETREKPRQILHPPPADTSTDLRQILPKGPAESAEQEPNHRTLPREPIARDARERAPARTRALSGVSIDGLPDPLKEHATVGGFEHVWRRWVAEGRALGLTMPSHPRGRDYQLVEELERLALDAVPDLVERTRFEAPEAFVRLVGLALRRYATQHREDAKRAPWKLGFVVSAWPELTKGAVPQAPPASRPAPTPTAPRPSAGTRETAEPPRVAWRAWVRASASVDRPADRAVGLAHTRDLATLDRRIREHAAPIAAARGVAVDVVADELAREVVERFVVAFQAERTSDAKEPPRLDWSPRSLLASLPSLLPQTQADPASRPKAAQTAA
jgi:hypothetical protein